MRVVRRVVVGGVIGALTMAMAACVPPAPRPVDPGVAATPEQVVRSWIAAGNAHDEALQRTLTDPTSWPTAAKDGHVRITVLDVHPAFDESTITGEPGPTMDVTVLQSASPHPASLPANPYLWTYLLRRDAGSGRWLIVDQGQG